MIRFEDAYFQKINFSDKQVRQFLASALRDLNIAKESKVLEVSFKFTYDSLIKLGIVLVAKRGFKVRSVLGHHVKILSALASILDNEDIEITGNIMRQKRNLDLYEGEIEITEKEVSEFLNFVEKIAKEVKLLID